MRQRRRVGGIVAIAGEPAAATVEAVEADLGASPQIAVAVLGHAVDAVVADASGICRIVPEGPKLAGPRV